MNEFTTLDKYQTHFSGDDEHPVTQYCNCRILRDGKIIWEDLWVQNGKIIDPLRRFFNLKKAADKQVDAKGFIVSPGYIDLQLNGGFGYDFSTLGDIKNGAIEKVAKDLLKYGCTSFCPTLITSKPETYRQIIPQIKPTKGNAKGANVLGIHLEGPFLSALKYGAHQKDYVKSEVPNGINTILDTYGSLEGVTLITVAPELPGMENAIPELRKRGIVVSAGHSMATIEQAERSVDLGVGLITHLFNAMVPFHHRDPGLVGLLGSQTKQTFFSMIVDDVHSHPNSVKIAYKAHSSGFVLITDSISAMGLPEGQHLLGPTTIDIKGGKAFVFGTETLAGSIITMDAAVRNFKKNTGCSVVEALEAATLHPAKALGIESSIGTLNYGSQADFILLDDELNVQSAFVCGEVGWTK